MDPQENKEKPQNPSEPKPILPQEPVAAPAPQSGAGHIDLGKILLPKKETPGQTVDSAQRINAGALLEQEIIASKEGTDTAQQHAEQKAAAQQSAPASVPTPAPMHSSLTPIPIPTPPPSAAPEPTPKPAEESAVRPLETFQRDIESVVQHQNVSVLSIATAEAKRREQSGEEEPETKQEKTRSLVLNVLMILGGIIFLVAASGALAYLVTRPTTVPIAVTATPTTPFINVDAAKEITITPDESRDKVLVNLEAAKEATALSLGLMSQLVVTESSSTVSNGAATVLTAQDFFTLLAPHMPPALARSLQPQYLLGVHVYNDNQPFVIAKVYSYEAAYSGMLAWEAFMQKDLSPLFNYTPSPRIPEQGIATTAPNPAGQFIQTGFVDKIVENHDARVLQTEYGDVYLLWTFVDRNTLVITTNDATLREIIRRLKDSPITPTPSGQ